MTKLTVTSLIVAVASAAAGAAAGVALTNDTEVHIDVATSTWAVTAVAVVVVFFVALHLWAPDRFREAMTWLLFAYLLGAALVLGDLVISLWSPAHTVSAKPVSVHLFGSHWSLKNLDATTIRLILLIAIGAVGGLIHVFWTFVARAGSVTFHERWAWWYLTGPLFGAAAAYALTLALGGGLVSFATTTDSNEIGLVSFAAFIAGLFSKTVLERMRRLLPEPQRSTGPQINEIKPSSIAKDATGEQAIEITGRSFSDATVVYLEGVKVSGVTRDGEKLTFKIDPATTANRPIALEVVDESRAGQAVIIERT